MRLTAMNTFGRNITFTSFGESHGVAVGGVLDGFPAGVSIDLAALKTSLDNRHPVAPFATQRHDTDQIHFLSGIEHTDDTHALTLGTPIAFYINNDDIRPTDYNAVPRPGHADMTYALRYGIPQQSGGGRASARETAARVVAGGICAQWLAQHEIRIYGFTSAIGDICIGKDYTEYDLSGVYHNAVRCPDTAVSEAMTRLLERLREEQDSIGGIVSCVVQGMPAGVGNPIFGRIPALLAHAMLTINAAKGFDYGSGFSDIAKRGSELNDAILPDWQSRPKQSPHTVTNHAGGCLGGITTGNDIVFRVAFKPTPSIGRGLRHDVCVVPRAVSVVEAMTALTLADALHAYSWQ